MLHDDVRTLVLEHKDALMLAYLAIEGRTRRATLAALLWPDVGEPRARGNLRQRLMRLRQSAGKPVVVGRTELSIADHVVHDLMGAPGVLGSLRFPETAAGDAWLCKQRESRSSAARRDIEHRAQVLEKAGDLGAALPLAETLLRLEPLSEAAHRRVMRLHYLRGDRAEALLAFDRCEHVLKHEVGTKPCSETLSLLQTIERAQAPTWLPGQPLPASALRPPRLIGRTLELAALATAWLSEQAFVLTGPAGSGKSRLLDAIADADASLLLVRARPGDDSVPLATLERLVQRLALRWPLLGSTPAYARWIAQVAGPAQGQSPSVQSVTPMVSALIDMARAHGLGGLLLDDLQFADAASADTWQELLMGTSLSGLRFGFASRLDDESALARTQSLGRHSAVAMVPLPALPPTDVQAFLESLGLPVADVPGVASALARRIGGNPLHLLETIRHAIERHGQLHADHLEAPARVTELLERRLVALPADGLLLVRIAAVAGNHFDPELAAAVTRRDVLELTDAWHSLERAGLLDARGFMHDLIGEAALRLLPQPIARVLHARIAAHLAQRGVDAARLAYHLLCAGDAVAAVPHLVMAARQAWHLGRSREASEAYLRAADIELSRGKPDAAFDLLYARAEVIEELGPRIALNDAIERLPALTHTPSQQARLAFMRTIRFHHDADHAGCQERIADALALAFASADKAIEAECRYTKAFYLAHGGQLRESVEQLMAAAALLRGVGREQRAMVIEGSAHTVLLWTGQARLALDLQRDALLRVLDAGTSNLRAIVMMRQADSVLRLGKVEEAGLLAHRARDALRATDMIGGELARTTWYIADVQRRCGQWSEALAIVDETRERIAAQSDPEQLLAALLARIYLDVGRPDLAHRHVEAFAAASQHSTRQRLRALALRWEYGFATGSSSETTAVVAAAMDSENLLQACELALAAGHATAPEVSAAQCATLIARCDPQGLREDLAPLNALCARLHAHAGDLPAACHCIARAEHALLAGTSGAAMPKCHLWLAQTLVALGRPAEAIIRAQLGVAWLAMAVQQSVPGEFHDSFMHGNPVHRDLLAIANGLVEGRADPSAAVHADR